MINDTSDPITEPADTAQQEPLSPGLLPPASQEAEPSPDAPQQADSPEAEPAPPAITPPVPEPPSADEPLDNPPLAQPVQKTAAFEGHPTNFDEETGLEIVDPDSTADDDADDEPLPTAAESGEAPAALSDNNKRDYWNKILTGDPASVPLTIRRKTGVDLLRISEEQKEYRLLSTVNKSWAADHLPLTREQIRNTWPQQRSELARKFGVRDNEHELFLALSEEAKDAPRREAATEIYNACYMAGLNGQSQTDIRSWQEKLSAEDARNARSLANTAYMQGSQNRQELLDLATRIAHGMDAFSAIEEDALSAPRVIEAAPDLMRAIDELADMDEDRRNIALYLATGMIREQHGDEKSPGLFARVTQAMRRGASRLGFGALQTVANAGIASLNKFGKTFDMEGVSGAAAAWDRRMQMFEKLRKISHEELRPLVLPSEANKAASYLITAAEATPGALLSCCGGAGFAALTFGAVGESIAEARNRAPLASQELQLYAGLLAGAIQAGIYMNLNRVGGRLLEQSISRIARAGGQGIAGYTLAGLNIMGSTAAETAKMLAAGKLANAVDLGAQEMAARLSKTASNINWEDFGNNLTDIEANMHEAASLLPYLLIGSGRLALHHFRSPHAILGEGKLLGDWGISEEQQRSILAERNLDTQSQMLQEAISGSKLWSGLGFLPEAVRALRLLHSDSFQEFKTPDQVCDFLKLPPPERPTPDVGKLPYDPSKAEGNPKLIQAMTMWNKWWTLARMDKELPPGQTPQSYNDLHLNFAQNRLNISNAPSYWSMDTQVPNRMLQLGVYAPRAEKERMMMLRDRIDDLNRISYQFLMNIYSVDTLIKDARSLNSVAYKTERARRSLLGAVTRAIVSTAHGIPRQDAVKKLYKHVENFYANRKFRKSVSTWLHQTTFKAIRQMGENADNYFVDQDMLRPELLNVLSMINGLRSNIDAIVDILPLTRDFQTVLSRGLSPAQAFANILSREFDLPEEIMHVDTDKLGREIRNNTPLLLYTMENADRVKTYSLLTGNEIEHAEGDEGIVYGRIRRPDGTLTHWHDKDNHVINDLAGNASMSFLPFGRRYNSFNMFTRNCREVDLTRIHLADSKEFSTYDQLCSLAKRDLSNMWVSSVTCTQPGMTVERRRRYFRHGSGDDGVTPLIKEAGAPGTTYTIDAYTEVTPYSMAQSRFYVYWQRMINSGLISSQDIGDFLVAREFITKDEKNAILSPPPPRIYYWRRDNKRRKIRQEAREAQRIGITRNIAAKMADYTTMRFLVELPSMPLPATVKEWVAMAAFCPEIKSGLPADNGDEESVNRESVTVKDDGTGLITWANRTVAQKLRKLAPQVDQFRKAHMRADLKRDPDMERMIQAAMGIHDSLRYEQGWSFEASGPAAAFGSPQSYWNLLQFPLKSWKIMSEEERAPYRARLRTICEHEPALIQSQPGRDVVDDAIGLLDELLNLYPEMHQYSLAYSSPGAIRRMELKSNLPEENVLDEPLYQSEPLYEWDQNFHKDYDIIAPPDSMPEFYTNDSRVHLGFLLLDELRSCRSGFPYAFYDGIWWNSKQYGYGATSPVDPEKFYAERPLEPLINLLQDLGQYERDHGSPMKICGVSVKGIHEELDLRPLRDVTIYRSRKNRRLAYRLMAGDPSLDKPCMRIPYVVHCRAGIYLDDHAAVRSVDNMDTVYVPLHKFTTQRYREYGSIRDEWLNMAWKYNLEEALQHCANAELYGNSLSNSYYMLEYLLRLTEDSGFSPSMAEVDPLTLSAGQAKLLNLTREMISCVCSHNPGAALKRLSKMVQSLDSPQKFDVLLRALRHSHTSVPGIDLGSMLDMEDVFSREFDNAAQESTLQTQVSPSPTPDDEP